MARQYYKDSTTGQMKPLGVKVEDTLPVGTEVDYDGQDIPEGWVEVDDPNEYSTSEVRIGTWLGKPLYRKTITISTLPNNGYNEYIIFTDTSVIDKCFLDEAHSYIDDNGNYLPCNFYYDTSNTITILITSAKKMRISTNRDRSNNTAEITINYTKTTD